MARFARLIAICLAAALVPLSAAAQYPNKPIKWIVPYPPGGTTDTLARIMAQWLSDKLGQQVVVENKPGGGNNIGTELALRSPADGYTMLLVNPAHGINHTLYKNLNFSILDDMAPVAGLILSPNVMEVTNAFPAKTVPEFIDYCKANPGKINWASSGTGTSVHMSGEMFKMMTGCEMLHIPFKGAGPAIAELIPGRVHVLFDNLPSSIGHIKGGRLRALAVTTKQPDPALPGIPTVDATVPGYEATAWFGIGMPKGTPKDVIAKLNAEIVKVLQAPEMREAISKDGAEPVGSTPEELGAYFRREVEKYAKVIRTANVQVE